MFKVWCLGVHIPFGHVEYMVTLTLVHILNKHWLIICLSHSEFFFFISPFLSCSLHEYLVIFTQTRQSLISKECPSFNQLSRKGHCLSENKQKYYKTTLQTPSTALAKVNNVYQQFIRKNIQNQKVYRDPAINRLDNWRDLYCIPQRLCPLVLSVPLLAVWFAAG